MDRLERLNELVNIINQHNINYYTLDNPTISDKEYDKLYDELVQLEKETKTILPNSPTQYVGGQTLKGFDKVKHKNRLWSLDKAQSNEELSEWLQWCENFVKDYNRTHTEKLPSLKYIVTKKFDGLTLKADYEPTDFIQCSTRGQGGIEGENVTEQCKTIINLPKQLKDNDKNMTFASFHGEGIMTKKAFAEYNLKAKEPLKNLRNGVAGAIRNLNPKETAKRKPIIYFYNINDIEGREFNSYQSQLEYMKIRGLPVVEYMVCNTYEDIISCIEFIKEIRSDLPFDIDGTVIAVDDIKTRELMGFTNKFPRYSIAYKYEAEETTTSLLDVEWNVSRLGRINPKAIIEPVELMGSTVSRATLNNLDDIKRKRIKLNSTVFIRKSNDVIPEITGVVEVNLNNSDIKDIIPPSKCPCCNADTEVVDGFVWCTNIDCDARLIQSITHFTEKKALNIVGLSISTVELLKQKGLIKSIIDIYKLKDNKKEILQLPKFAIKKYNNLIESIEKSRDVKLGNFIYSLGIPNVGEVASGKLAEKFISLDNVLNAKRQELLNIDDIGDTTADSILHYIKTNNELIDNLKKELNIIDYQIKESTNVQDNPLKYKHVYPTGTFSLKKTELKLQLEKVGAIIETGYKKSLDFLIVANDSSKSGKADKAIKDKVMIMSEDEINQILEQFAK